MVITLEEFADRFGMSDEACEIVGLNPWCLNEGLATNEDKIEITREMAAKLGISDLEYRDRS